MIRLSISNLAWDKKDDLKMYRHLSDTGFSGIEIAPARLWEYPYNCLDEAEEWAKMIKREYNLEIPSMQSIWYGRTENLFRSEADRASLLGYTSRAMAFAEKLSCRNLVFGCPKNRNREAPSEKDVETADRFFRDMGMLAQKHDVILGIEANPVIYHTNYLTKTEDVIKLIKSDLTGRLGLNLDFGTILYNQEPLETVREILPLISHIHISEPGLTLIKKRQEHRKLFQMLYEGNYSHFVSIEMGKCEDVETVIAVMKYVKEVCQDAES